MKALPQVWKFALAALCTTGAIFASATTRAEDKLLSEIVEFNGTMLFLESRVPGMIIGVVRNGETAIVGFGET
jgi:D-alanyl-D-alanine-carboxypeptidase/D-alanyl-D-alanine-endopeptidase